MHQFNFVGISNLSQRLNLFRRCLCPITIEAFVKQFCVNVDATTSATNIFTQVNAVPVLQHVAVHFGTTRTRLGQYVTCTSKISCQRQHFRALSNVGLFLSGNTRIGLVFALLLSNNTRIGLCFSIIFSNNTRIGLCFSIPFSNNTRIGLCFKLFAKQGCARTAKKRPLHMKSTARQTYQFLRFVHLSKQMSL
jgi:hypothetical protein